MTWYLFITSKVDVLKHIVTV